MAAGLLDVDVLAGLQSQEGGRRVPVIRRGNHQRVHVLIVEDAAEVRHAFGRLRLRPLDLVDGFDAPFPGAAIDVADVGYLILAR